VLYGGLVRRSFGRMFGACGGAVTANIFPSTGDAELSQAEQQAVD
jgi:hypothetical protein